VAIATPFAVVIDATGHIRRSEPVGSRAALRHLLEQIDTVSDTPTGPTVHPSQREGTQ
jgi:hypothetical protein